jgi:hypothetical protein
MMRRFALITALIGLSACGSNNTPAPTTPTPQPTPTPTVTSLTVTGTGCSNGICPGQVGNNLQLTATAHLSNNTAQDVTSQATWSTTNSTVATVSSGGLVTFRGAGDADIIAVYQGKLDGQTMRLIPAGPKNSFGAGTYLVNKDILAGRYFALSASSSCYWERESGLGGTLGEIIANDFVGFTPGQLIVDIAGSDLAFKTQSACGNWSQTPKSDVSRTTISPGFWLVNAQLQPGVYRANVSSGCYWERLRNFGGTLDGIIANDFISSGGQQLVEVRSGDAGFDANSSCGTWTLTTGLAPSQGVEELQSPASIEANWRTYRMSKGQ